MKSKDVSCVKAIKSIEIFYELGWYRVYYVPKWDVFLLKKGGK